MHVKKSNININAREADGAVGIQYDPLTLVFEGSHEKKRVKNDGSFPSVTTYIGDSRDNPSSKTSFSRNFCSLKRIKKIRTCRIIGHLKILQPKICFNYVMLPIDSITKNANVEWTGLWCLNYVKTETKT